MRINYFEKSFDVSRYKSISTQRSTAMDMILHFFGLRESPITVFEKELHDQGIFNLENKEEIIGITSREITDRQKHILEKYIPYEALLEGHLAFFDAKNAIKEWSIDFLPERSFPRLLFIHFPNFIKRLRKYKFYFEKYRIQDQDICLPIDDFWLFSLDITEYFQHCILVTECCDLSCVMCPFHSKSIDWTFKGLRRPGFGKRHIEEKLFDKFLQDIPSTSQVRISGNGEPFLHPHLLDMIRKIKEKGFAISLWTHGNLLTNEILKRMAELKVDSIVLSIEGITPETYGSIRKGGNFNKVISVIKECRRLKERGEAQWDICVEYNELESLPFSKEEVCHFYKNIIDRITFRRAFKDPWTENFSKEDMKFFDTIPSYCFDILHGPFLSPSGKVLPCAVMANLEWFEDMPWAPSIADMDVKSIMEVYKKLIQQEDSDFKKICAKCTFYKHAYRKKGSKIDPYFHTEYF